MSPALARPAPRRRAGPLAAALPAIAFVALFGLGPLAVMAVFSVLKAAPHGGVEWQISAEGWRALLSRRDIFDGGLHLSADHLLIYGRSFLSALVTTALCVAVGFPLAWFIATRTPARRKWWVLAVTVPFWSSLLVRTLALMLILGDRGLVNGALIGLGLIQQPLRMLYTEVAVMAGLVYASLPFMVLPVYSALARLDPRLVEAAADLHAGRWSILRHVLWPAARPGVLAGALLVFVPALGAYVVPLVLGGGRSMMIGDLIALQFGSSRNWPLGAAESIVLLAGVLAALAIHRRLEKRP